MHGHPAPVDGDRTIRLRRHLHPTGRSVLQPQTRPAAPSADPDRRTRHRDAARRRRACRPVEHTRRRPRRLHPAKRSPRSILRRDRSRPRLDHALHPSASLLRPRCRDPRLDRVRHRRRLPPHRSGIARSVSGKRRTLDHPRAHQRVDLSACPARGSADAKPASRRDAVARQDLREPGSRPWNSLWLSARLVRASSRADFDPRIMAGAIRAAIDAVPPQLARDPELDIDRYGRELADLFELAIRAEAEPRSRRGPPSPRPRPKDRRVVPRAACERPPIPIFMVTILRRGVS